MATVDIIKPKAPLTEGWIEVDPSDLMETAYPISAWLRPGDEIFVFSAVEVADRGIGPEYHLSITRQGRRCDSVTAMSVLRQFGLEDATEDNHVSGTARHFWRPVADWLSGIVCPCTEEEPAIVEDKGDYVWRQVTL